MRTCDLENFNRENPPIKDRTSIVSSFYNYSQHSTLLDSDDYSGRKFGSTLGSSPSEPLKLMKHGDVMHLAFSYEQLGSENFMQLSGQLSRSFNTTVPCLNLGDKQVIGVEHKIRIVGHSSKDYICGGDEISIARSDKRFLRLRKMSNKLAFSKTKDFKARFVVSGVPNGAKVHTTTRFYLSTSHDPTVRIGFVCNKNGSLVTFNCNQNMKNVEPVYFFKKTNTNQSTIY